MTATAHALIGASIVKLIPDPAVSLPLALLSHFICDKVPHWDVMVNKNKTKRQIFIQSTVDVLLGFTLVWIIFAAYQQTTNPTVTLLGALMAQLPDWLELPYFFFGKNFPIAYQNYKIQKWVHDLWFDARLKAPWGVVTQLTVVTLFLIWSLR